ncbi:hypothetical protein D3C81_2293880 [compost metagenome]
MKQVRLSWQLVDDQKTVYARGERPVVDSLNGKVTELGMIEVETPLLQVGKHVTLQARLSGDM